MLGEPSANVSKENDDMPKRTWLQREERTNTPRHIAHRAIEFLCCLDKVRVLTRGSNAI